MIVNYAMREPIVMNTMVNSPRDIKEKHLAGLVAKTTGLPMGSGLMMGVLENTTGKRRDVPELHKVPKGEVGKTESKRMGQVPFAGPKY
jgi:hypothetical protein